MDLAAVMDEIADRLSTAGLRCAGWPAGKVSPPGAIVGYPTSYTYDDTPGTDVMHLPIVVVAGGVATSKAARDAVSGYIRPVGSQSVPLIMESNEGGYSSFDTINFMTVDFDVYTIGGVDYPAVIFDCEISGKHER